MHAQQQPPSYESSANDVKPMVSTSTTEPEFPALQTQQNGGRAEDAYAENRFGELGRADTFEEDRDLGHLGPIVREVGDKLKEAKNKLMSSDHCDKK